MKRRANGPGGPEFCYVKEWVGPNSAALEFVTAIDGIEVNGVDLAAALVG